MNLIRTNNRTFDRIFDDFFGPDFHSVGRNGGSARWSHAPKVNIAQDDEGYHIQMAVPGWKKEDFSIEIDQDVLTISADADQPKDAEALTFVRREFSKSSFRRAFRLPDTVEGDQISAAYEDGVLTLALPKKEEAKPAPAKTISIA
ncbi:MAG: Hsp20/alpha crystallin family protein [Bacteroidota bacterium]